MDAPAPAGEEADPALARITEQIRTAHAEGSPLEIRGGGSKAFYGHACSGQPLDVRPLCGIRSYDPSELVVTAGAGTPLAELEATLAAQGQWLPFEPPHFGPGSTVGGMVAAGLAGPARASAGGVRDYVLGAALVNGRGELLHFGGQVMKNVAGYDVSRLLCGSLGMLGVIAEVSLKVLPQPVAQATLRLELDQAGALARLHQWAAQPLPLSASAWWDGMLVLRLAGARAAVDAACRSLGGEPIEAALAAPFWAGLRDHHDEFFVSARKAVQAGAALWRLSLPPTAPVLALSGEQLIEWGGAQRWLCTSTPAAQLRQAAASHGGHAVLFCGHDKQAGVFAPLPPVQERIQRALKTAFDPAGIFNRGRMYPGW